jgi:hypothetical protein
MNYEPPGEYYLVHT